MVVQKNNFSLSGETTFWLKKQKYGLKDNHYKAIYKGIRIEGCVVQDIKLNFVSLKHKAYIWDFDE